VKERPILFSAPMVRALLAGTKTQTRRALRAQPVDTPHAGQASLNRTMTRPVFYAAWDKRAADGSTICICPYGVPGDRLWVREAWTFVGTLDPGVLVYRADYPACVPKHYENVPPASALKWRPSIHMGRDQSRLTLKVTGVCVERLQDISEADCWAEGIEAVDGMFDSEIHAMAKRIHGKGFEDAVPTYACLWESINGPGSWNANPWVWCLSFRRVDAELAQRTAAAEEVAA
jgi:hypothetical protein